MGYKGHYTGIDINQHKDFDKESTYPFKSILIESKMEDFESDKKFDLVLSNCALEHIKNDALVISKCDYFLKPGGIQIHVIPSFWSLFLYLWHGYRQYNPKRIKSLFNQKHYKVYRLGGFFSFFLHLFFITIPVIFFRTNKLIDLSWYPKLIEICNRFDKVLPILSYFYVVVVKKDV